MEVVKDNNNKYMNLEATELRLGLPGSDDLKDSRTNSSCSKKRPLPEEDSQSSTNISTISSVGNQQDDHNTAPPPPKAQIVGWPPIRSYRKNNLQTTTTNKPTSTTEHATPGYVKLSMDGAPYLRKIDLNHYTTYPDLLKAMEDMFRVTIGQYTKREGYNGSDYTPTYEDRDGDWMLVGDVPWTMFVSTCKRLRIMKSSEAKGLGRCC